MLFGSIFSPNPLNPIGKKAFISIGIMLKSLEIRHFGTTYASIRTGSKMLS